MKKESYLIFIAAILLLIPLASADVQLTEKAVDNVIIKELSNPATFDITISNNNDYSDIFVVDTLFDMNITPQERVLVDKNSAKTITRDVYPSADMRKTENGIRAFDYYANGDKSNVVKSILTFDFVSLDDLITIDAPATILQDDSEVQITLNLTRDTTLNANLVLVSQLLSYKKEITLTKEGIVLTVPLNDVKPKAGTYEVKATFDFDGYEFSKSKDITLESVISTKDESSESGYFLNRNLIFSRQNTGNSVTDVTITVNKSVIAGLFTSFNLVPSNTRQVGGRAFYDFTKELNPNETLTVKATTSYYLPIAIIILLIAAGWIFVVVITPKVKIEKKAVRVRTKSGAFATKLVLHIKNKGKNEVTGLKIIDRLPAFTELVPEKFGTVSPTEIRKSTLVWNIDRLLPQEDIMLSYIVYSKLTIIGKLDIPLAFATYQDLKGNLKESKSNGLSVIAPEQPPVQSQVIS